LNDIDARLERRFGKRRTPASGNRKFNETTGDRINDGRGLFFPGRRPAQIVERQSHVVAGASAI
jgi:hypothetical protein